MSSHFAPWLKPRLSSAELYEGLCRAGETDQTAFYNPHSDLATVRSLMGIEQFIDEIAASEEPGFLLTEGFSDGHWQPLSLGERYGQLSGFVQHVSPMVLYSPKVELFMEACQTHYFLGHPPVDPGQPIYAPTPRGSGASAFNELVQHVRHRLKSKGYESECALRRQQVQKTYQGCLRYIDRWLDEQPDWYVVKLDLGYRGYPQLVQASAQAHFRALESALSEELRALHGWIWRLQYSRERGFHYALILFLDPASWLEPSAGIVLQRWYQLTLGRGEGYDSGHSRCPYERLGAGPLRRSDAGSLEQMALAIDYLCLMDGHLRVRSTRREATAGKATFTKSSRRAAWSGWDGGGGMTTPGYGQSRVI